MSYSTQHAFRPVEANVNLSQIQFADYPNRDVQVADYTQVNYLQPSDSEEELDEDEVMNYEDVERKLTPCFFFVFVFFCFRKPGSPMNVQEY